jgi:hypothetical protein
MLDVTGSGGVGVSGGSDAVLDAGRFVSASQVHLVIDQVEYALFRQITMVQLIDAPSQTQLTEA